MACPVRAAAFPTDNASASGRICQDPAEGGEEHLHHHDDREDQAALNIRVTLRVYMHSVVNGVISASVQAAQKTKSLWHIQTLNEFSRKMKK